jgi:hypothetical protein
MKKIFIAVIVMLTIIASAFTLKSGKSVTTKPNDKKFTSYYWFVGVFYTGRQNTHAAELMPSGCPDTGTSHCEDGYLGDDFNILFFSKINY